MSQHLYFFIDESGDSAFYARRKRPLWTLKRYITTGDKRYFAALENKFEEIYDVYENGGKGRIYNKSDGFDVSKASSFAIK